MITLNEWFERTENGSQEHTLWDSNDSNRRFETCFCENCGTDCNGNHCNKSLEKLKPLAKNIYRYITLETEYDLDAKQFDTAVRELQQLRSAQGNETEVLGAAFARALESDRATADVDHAVRPVAISD
ncbi:hypothetical protein Htur_4933 (plasmid) [Haloterrigena turkmenica DSM 5511]|uniref:Uncharacterized protein n=1 Tax=Haloterrigena turkmenica (strain ATCC 51198 / DSM 5511 / JCM 9101 / NCIMB 13204 / VKM B-1734 / 4k) TaxID=543526 RepID=D2S2S3_HALTV|nr:hypothetical protein [Haloterrigena turkmenica]ADB63670.1 hypothetical protein Htur_4933 [Haloterrigena turkmenica DSM 5511]